MYLQFLSIVCRFCAASVSGGMEVKMGNKIEKDDKLIIGGHSFDSRFILGSGKYSLDLIQAAVEHAGAATIMPLAAPIGSNKGLCTKEFIQILIDEIDLPIIVDAGIGAPSQACEAMEMGAAAVMANTAIATAGDIIQMAEAFRLAIQAGRQAYLSGLGRVMEKGASASSPLTGFLQ